MNLCIQGETKFFIKNLKIKHKTNILIEITFALGIDANSIYNHLKRIFDKELTGKEKDTR